MKGFLNKQNSVFCVEFDEVQYTEDGLDYQGNDIVEIHPDDIIKFNITDEMIGKEVKFKKQWVVDNDDEFYYVRLIP